ncbi:olfactory receptor 51E1-like [Ambystoma mexicanum]|uniref:olfactory receptor 51E1-like n=1 Tax=Ambystoma mexicanum TaxID=8296 RepID=UPI0037E8EBB3
MKRRKWRLCSNQIGQQEAAMTYNVTNSSSATFMLSGVPGLEDFHFWIAFPLCSMYIIALFGNFVILFIIKTGPSLHEPMYIFLCMLSVVDMLLATTTMPRMLVLLWLDSREISFDTCLIQIFCIHFLSAIESGILVAMAFDRYTAICHPLRYTSILTNRMSGRIGVVILVRGVTLMVPLPILLKILPFCGHNVLNHSYCLHQDAMKLACGDNQVNFVYGLFVIISVMGIDLLFISLSYVLIIKTVLCLSSEEANFKSFRTCAAHICAVVLFYVPLIGLSVVHRLGPSTISHISIHMGNIYLLVPPVLNPIVYGINTKQIRVRIVKMFSKKRYSSKVNCNPNQSTGL